MKATLSLDLDNKWSYMKTHGDSGWQSMPSYINLLVPRVLDILDQLHLKITVFIVGQDAAMPAHAESLGEIARRGHEIGNHSHYHEPWMHRRGVVAINDELALAEESIAKATGHHPRGFRGPGFTHSTALLKTLVQRGYQYDASSLPTFIGPLARAYYFRSTKLNLEARKEREDLFGRFADGFRPNRRYDIELTNGSIAEIPVTTMPLLRVPIHVSYLVYLATLSPEAARAYFQVALLMCRLTGTQPSILLHPLDFLDGSECPELRFFPGMNLKPGVKRQVVFEAIRMLANQFEVYPLRERVEAKRDRVRDSVGDSVGNRSGTLAVLTGDSKK
jgi:peptidoglycan/xylan/chitin deacetylase (PgdA/CDA1 family)